ncbi:hypothetical protein [Paracoccus sp. (in: a-proteobacteria)]|uniref:hypothetical protein n=1 Tax=Paracoccus sp. TaxID=267 RepID=UPI003A89145F
MSASAEADLTRALLGLYECAIVPERYRDLTHELETLLAERSDTSTVVALEQHSETIWRKAASLLFSDPGGSPNDGGGLEITPRKVDTPEIRAFLDRVPADDQRRLFALIDGHQPETRAVIRAETGDSGALALHLARRVGDRVRVFRLTNDLAVEVETLLISQFRISASEMQVLRGLVSGQALKALAAETGKSVETIRSQTKSIAAKLGFSRQNEISAAINSIARAAGPGTARRAETALDSVRLRDGRVLYYNRTGAPNGKNVLFFHDFSGSCRWPQAVVAQFAQAGLRVISPARAGFGPSSVNRRTQMQLFEDHLDDYAELMDQLGIDACHMLAFGTGFGLAHSLCRREPARARFLVGLNVYPPILSRHDAMQFPPGMYRAGSLAALFAPRTCALISRYASRRAAAAGNITELDQLTGHQGANGEREERFFHDFIQPNLADVMQARARGVWRDCTCLTIPWTTLYQRATPVRAIILQNADFPFQPLDRIRDLAESLDLPFKTLPRPYRHFIDDFGDVLDHYAGWA